MEQNQQQRRAAASKFFQSLNQLENMLLSQENQEKEVLEVDSGSPTDDETTTDSPAIDMEAFEEAVADIEQYFKS